MEVVKAIYQRRAVRSYTGESVERECIERLIDAAIQAPSAHNAQPWAFCATNDRALMQHIAHESRAHLLRHLPPHSSLPQLMPTLLDEECDIFYGAAAFIVVSATSEDTWAAEACGMAAQNLMLAACAEGLASCCIGLARPWLELPENRALLGAHASHRPLLPIVVGHPSPTPIGACSRRAPELHWMDSELIALR